MADQEQAVLSEAKGRVRVATLNRPLQLNVINSSMVSLLAEYLENWEKDPDVELVLVKGNGRAFCAGGDLKMFYDGRNSRDSCLEVAYRMYWLCYHIHTYKLTTVALAHGLAVGGGAAFLVPTTFSVVCEKTVFSTPEASIGYHTDCSFSYVLSRLPGRLGEFLGLTGARLNGKEMVAIGLASHFVPSDKMAELEEALMRLNKGDTVLVRSVIEEFSVDVQHDEGSVLNKRQTIDDCFSKDDVSQIIAALEDEAKTEGGEWVLPILKSLKRSSPTGLKVTLKSIREGRAQTLSECLNKEFRLTINIQRSVLCEDFYEGIRSLTIDKDNSPKWDPSSLEEVEDEKIDMLFKPFDEDKELRLPASKHDRWDGKYETSSYGS